MDYRQTLKLPTTEFPMRAQLAVREPRMLAEWDRKGLYKKLVEQREREGAPRFVLHDGPPYANGHVHIGTAMNKILKDMIVRSRAMDGYWCPYVPGWDTHGLPIERRVIEEQGIDRHQVDPLELRRLCHEYALKYRDIQREEFKRLGVWGDWDNPYLTLEPEYEARQVEVFGAMAQAGYIFKGLKPVYWCPECETALAEAEIEYRDHRSPSIYVKFAVTDGRGVIPEGAAVLIWTTTPWTIPANLAIALHPDLDYVLARTDRGDLLVASGRLQQIQEETGIQVRETVGPWKGRELEGIQTRHPLYDRASPLILGEHVTLEQGTGCVHTAPGHGLEDYEMGVRYGLPILSPVDDRGRFTEEAAPFAGLSLEEGNRAVIAALADADSLLASAEIEHQYPHCWRCRNPVVFRATEQWFASVDGFREAALKAIDEVQWIPPWGRERIRNMVAERSDWCISRQRAWGVPIPAFYCLGCEQPLISEETIRAVADVFRREGSDAWFRYSAAELLPDGVRCPRCGGGEFRKETDIMDVWFDSGSSHAAVLETRPELTWPADMYLEGSDQHRGWFQSSLLTSVATRGKAPYRSVLTHGFVVDESGRKMSKSLGNVIAPDEVVRELGADILRLWVASADYRGDVRISRDILKQLTEVYRRIRNTARFLLANVADFDPERHYVNEADRLQLDRWATLRVRRLAERVTAAYRRYEFHHLFRDLNTFCAVDMGGFYLDAVKDRLYCDGGDSHRRRSAQSTLWDILCHLVRLMAPVLVFTAEDIWQHMPPAARTSESVHLERWDFAPAPADPEFDGLWEQILALRSHVTKALEEARSADRIGSSVEASLAIRVPASLEAQLAALEDEEPGALEEIFIVSGVRFVAGEGDEVQVTVERAPGEKCARCWRYSPEVGRSEAHPSLCPRCTDVVTALGL